MASLKSKVFGSSIPEEIYSLSSNLTLNDLKYQKAKIELKSLRNMILLPVKTKGNE